MIRISEDIVFPEHGPHYNKHLYYLKHGTYTYHFLGPEPYYNKEYLISPKQMKKQFYSRRTTNRGVLSYLRFNEEVRLKHILWAYENGIMGDATRFQLDIFQIRCFGNFYEELYNIIIVQNKQIISKSEEYITRTPKNSREREFMGKLQNAGFRCSKGDIGPFSFRRPDAFAFLNYYNEKPPKL